jgi:hypothetical protein
MDFLKGKDPQVISEDTSETKPVRLALTKNSGEESGKKPTGNIAPFNKGLFSSGTDQLGLVRHTSHAATKRQNRKE